MGDSRTGPFQQDFEHNSESVRAECHRLVDKIFSEDLRWPPELQALFDRMPEEMRAANDIGEMRKAAYKALRASALEFFPDELAGLMAVLEDPAVLIEASSAVGAKRRVAEEAYRAAHPAQE